ncbi:MAG: hypothetical protein ACTTK1_07095 [Candidatus Cryptobacteroides sp.]
MSRSANFLLIAAISAVVFLGCKKERSFRGANPGDEIVFGGTAGSASGFRSSKTKGGDGDSSASGAFAGAGLDASEMESCGSYDSDADETYFFDWEDFEGGDGFGSSDANALFVASDSDVQTKTDYSGHKENVGSKKYERIDWVAGDKVRIFGDNVLTSGGAPSNMVYKVTSPSIKTGDASRSSASLEKESAGTMGLRWDSGNADFYAAYPGDTPTKLSFYSDGLAFWATAKLPKEQNNFTKSVSGNHTEFKPDMELAAMLAISRGVSPIPSVQLDFFPLVTTFRVTLSNSLPNEDMKINKVSLVSSSSEPMSGNCVFKYYKGSGSVPVQQYLYASSILSPSNEISVDLGSEAITLTRNNGNNLSVTLFAAPLQYNALRLKVNLTQGGKTEDRILELKQNSPLGWLKFFQYRKYDINIGIHNKMEYHLEVSSPLTVPYTGGSISGWVKSYKTDGFTTKAVPWRVEYYSLAGLSVLPFNSRPPAWLTVSPSNGLGVNNPSYSESVWVSVSANTEGVLTNSNSVTGYLRGKDEVGTQTEPIDLSRVPVGNFPFFSIPNGANASTYASKPMNTANCYVVTRPGWYKIPVVYGNGIKNSVPNPSAYISSASGADVLQNFIRHDENAISDPWIKDNGINLDNGVAELVWQDRPNLVQNIEFDKNNKAYISFYISKTNIHEGNAVIALKDNSHTIVWSWHIWVYGGNNLKTINVKNNIAKSGGRPGRDNFNFLSENLGACYDGGESMTYSKSDVWMCIQSKESTLLRKWIKITRNGGISSNFKYNSTYYQYGRKDPMLPSDGTTSNQNKVWFDKSGTSKNNFPTSEWQSDGSVSKAKDEIARTIKYPGTFNSCDNMDNLYYNLWDTNCNETGNNNDITTARFEPVTKSVYDPCPPGFCLPPNGAFTGFTSTGKQSYNSSEWNVSGPFSEGYHFRTVLKGESGSSTIFFPASGYRYNYGGTLSTVGNSGYYLSSVPYVMYGEFILAFGTISVSPSEFNFRPIGFSLRPVKEN